MYYWVFVNGMEISRIMGGSGGTTNFTGMVIGHFKITPVIYCKRHLTFNSILHLTAFTIYDAVLSPSLLCMYTCLASDFSGKFNIHFTWTWPRYIVIRFLIGGRKKLPLILVEFVIVQTVNMVNAWTVNSAVPQNSLFTGWHHLSH